MVTKGNEQSQGKKEKLARRPAREFQVGMSKDGKYWLFRDTTTWFIPVNYLGAIQKSAAAKAQALAENAVAKDGGADGRSH